MDLLLRGPSVLALQSSEVWVMLVALGLGRNSEFHFCHSSTRSCSLPLRQKCRWVQSFRPCSIEMCLPMTIAKNATTCGERPVRKASQFWMSHSAPSLLSNPLTTCLLYCSSLPLTWHPPTPASTHLHQSGAHPIHAGCYA